MTHADSARQVGDQIEQLVGEVRAMVSPPAWQRIDRLVRAVVELYGAGLERVMAQLDAAGADAAAVRARVIADPLLASLLVLHGLHPETLGQRVEQALERVRPYLGSHGGDVEIVDTDDATGVVRLKMKGSCDGCPSSLLTVKLAVEGAIHEAAPEVVRVEVEGVSESSLPPSGPPRAGPDGDRDEMSLPASTWVALGALEDLTPGVVRAREMAGARFLLCRLDEQLYAYRDVCAACGSTMDGGALDGGGLSCPSCAERFDVRRAGRSLGGRDLHLDPFPLLEQGGRVTIALPPG